MPPARGNNVTSTKRIRREIAELARENLGDIQLTPNDSNIYQWRATIPGPVGSPYEGGMFDVDIRVPEDYPFSPPHLQFLTRVYHCNIADSGAICLDLLKTAWSPALSLYKVILSLSSLLTDPNPADPLVPSIAQEYKKNRKRHDETAREWVKLYAIPKSKPAASATAAAAPAPRAPRPRAIQRPLNGSSSAPPPSIAGTRRRAAGSSAGEAIDLVDDDDDEVEVLGESSSASANGGGGAAPRRSKRSRVEGDSDDVIVIDD